jgi:hypothetical protein
MNHIEEMIPKLSAASYAIRSMVHINNMNTFISVYYAYFHSIIKYGSFGVILPTVGIFSLYKRISSELWLVQNPEPHVEVYSNNKQIHLYIILIQGISIIFMGQMPTYFVFKEVHSMLA